MEFMSITPQKKYYSHRYMEEQVPTNNEKRNELRQIKFSMGLKIENIEKYKKSYDSSIKKVENLMTFMNFTQL